MTASRIAGPGEPQTSDIPHVGDKVVYCGDALPVWSALWEARTREPGIVLAVDDGDPDTGQEPSLRVWSPGEMDWYGTHTSRVRVVERATYIPVAEPSDVDGAS